MDTASTLSIIPLHLLQQCNIPTTDTSPISVQQADGQFFITKQANITLKLGKITKTLKIFVVDNNLDYIILGLPACRTYQLVIDCFQHKIFQLGQQLKIKTNHNVCSSNKISLVVVTGDHVNQSLASEEVNHDLQTATHDPKLDHLLHQYNKVFSQDKYDIGKINIEPQRIRLTSDLPVSLRPYRASPKDEIEIKTQIDNMLKYGIIKESCSPYSSPVTLVAKKNETSRTRFCVDYRKLNHLCVSDSMPLPRIDTLLDKLSSAQMFSTLDLTSGYWHVPIHPLDSEKLAFATNFGLYEWNRLPFGLKNAPAIFNRVLRQILNKYRINFVAQYFDDLVIYSKNKEEHLQHLEELFSIFAQENIKLNFKKCVFAQEKINFLGYEIQKGTISPSNVNIESIKKLTPPTNVKELQRFLGSINVYHKFIDKYAEIRYPLNKLLKKDTPWVWTDECQNNFELLKSLLISKPILRLFNPNLPCHVFTDASLTAIGSVLKQPDASNVLHPIAFHSRTLRDFEKNYSITELECLAIIDSIDKFYYYLHGQKFIIHTDHAALIWLKKIKNPRGRLFRWSLKLSMFEYEIVYTKGSLNFEADMLSRIPVVHHTQHHKTHLLDLNEIKTQQQHDNLCGNKYQNINDVIVIKKKNLHKIVIPFSLRRKLLHEAHSQFGHPGIQKMINLITPHYYWPYINEDIAKFVKHCHTCQMNKKPRQKRFGLLQTVPQPEKPFELISLDTVGGFNYYNSTKKFLHVVIDHATRYIWAFPSKNETAESYINCLKQIFQIQQPLNLLTDRNAAFTSTRLKHFLRNFNVKHLFTSSHRPQTNGTSERCQQSLVTMLKCKVNSSSTKVPWTKWLEQVVSEYNNTPHTVTKFPPNYLMFGIMPFQSPLNQDNIYPSIDDARKLAQNRTVKYHERNKNYYDARFIDKQFKVGDSVIYEEFQYPNTRKLTSPFSGPYTILRKTSDVNYELDRVNQITKVNEIVHISKLRPYYPPQELKLRHE